MGVDFLAKTKDSRNRAWDRGRSQLATDDLLKKIPSEKDRTCLFERVSGAILLENEEIFVCEREQRILAVRKKTEIAQAVNPPAEIVDCLKSMGGWSKAIVKRVHQRSGCADILIK